MPTHLTLNSLNKEAIKKHRKHNYGSDVKPGKAQIIQLVPESPKELTFNIVFLPSDKNGQRHLAMTNLTKLQLSCFVKDLVSGKPKRIYKSWFLFF